MSKSKHTPRPWEVFAGDSVGVRTAYPVNDIGGMPAKFELCRTGTTEEAKANARLIAAAPEMLAALKRIVEWEKDPDRYSGDLADICHDIATVVAKAEGE